MTELAAALLLGGFVGLDATSFPQAMYSRPFVAGALAGLIVGRPVEGAMLGMLLEFFALPVMPFGAAAYPEGGTAAVASTLAYHRMSAGFEGDMLFLAVVLGLLLSHATGYSVRLLRIQNGKAVGGAQGQPIEPATVERAHKLAMMLDFLRGAAVTGAGTAVLVVALGLAARVGWALPFSSLGLLIVAAAMMIGGSITVFGTVRERILSFGVGIVLTTLLVWLI